MSISDKIRAQIIGNFRAELNDHVQTLNDGLLAIEQNRIPAGELEERMATIFRAAHSLKGAARAVGVTAIEQIAHALEDVLGNLQKNTLSATPAMFTACYKAVDAVMLVEQAYEAGETTPPVESLLSLAGLEPFRHGEPSLRLDRSDQGLRLDRSDQGLRLDRSDQASGSQVLPTLQDPAEAQTKDPKTDSPRGRTSRNGLENLRTALNGSREAFESAPEKEDDTPAATPTLVDETIRVSVGKLDSLMEQLNELLVTKIRAEQRLTQVRQAQNYVANWQKDWLKIRAGYSRISRHRALGDAAGLVSNSQRKEFDHLLDYVQASQEHLKELNTLLNALTREYHSDTMQMSLAIDRLEEEVKRVRMLPFKTIALPFARMVRDLAQRDGKEVAFELIGGEVELDKHVLEQVKDPLIHMLRNAVDHGIEKPARRLASGKPAQGKIMLTVEQMGKDVSISIQDDGTGLDLDNLRETALRRKVKNAATLSDSELIELIYAAGFSTSPMITDVSGRGVGLDVVRRNVEGLHGRIMLESKAGMGTRFTLVLPVALTTSRGLLVQAGGQVFAIPIHAIERILHLQPATIEMVSGKQTIRHADRSLNLVHLADVLGLPRTRLMSTEYLPVVILSYAERQIAFVVDALIDEQEVVIKSLGKQIARVNGIAGASLMGNGDVLLVLNAADIIKLAGREDHQPISSTAEPEEPSTSAAAKRTILVVDDSITTRTLEKNILEAAGYIVRLALDGQEAFNMLMTSSLPDLVISDVQMPRMDGLSLAAHIKKEPRTAQLPVILVTSLESAEDKAKGVEAGADAYIVKRSFDQINLLETISQLI